MTTVEKLRAIEAAIQTDPGNRGLAKVPGNNLFTATAGQFEAAATAIDRLRDVPIRILTGFYIPTAAAFETDGPLGAFFLERALNHLGYRAEAVAEPTLSKLFTAARIRFGRSGLPIPKDTESAWIATERSGVAADGERYTMRGRCITEHFDPAWDDAFSNSKHPTIGIGDGGNELGMGSISTATIAENIEGGAKIHCVVPCSHLIVCGVSNWGAYALAAGLFALRKETPPTELFDAFSELAILEFLVQCGPLVDGVTGKPTATVDGLSWEEYVIPLIRIREILAC